MAKQGRNGLSRKTHSGKNTAKIASKFSPTSQNVDKAMKVSQKVEAVAKRVKPVRVVDDTPKWESAPLPRTDGRFVFERPTRGRTLTRGRGQ